MSSQRLTPLLLGPCPEKWAQPFIEEVTDLLTNGFVGPSLLHQTESSETGIRYLQGFNVRPNRVDLAHTTWVTRKFHSKNRKSQLCEGDVLVVQSGHIGTAAVVPKEAAGSNCHAVIICRFKSKIINPQFASQYLNSEIGQARLRGLHVGSSLPHINTSELGRFRIPSPSIDEQNRIADVLTSWDIAIQRTEQLMAAKERNLRHFRNLLLRQSPRGSKTTLRTITHELTGRNGNTLGRAEIMAVTKHVGMRPMREETIAAKIERYKVVPPRAFAYNPMRLNIGSIAMSAFESNVLVSPDYVVFACDESRLLPAYLNHLRYSQSWKSHFELAGNGSVRVRIYYDDLATFSFCLPSIADQAKIVHILDAAAQEIVLLERQAQALRKQKRGLMQKLLTGQWRLQLPEEEAV